MKRAKPKTRKDRDPDGVPVSRYNKRPHVYSEEYRTWKANVARHVARTL